jgi:hypothetical protein
MGQDKEKQETNHKKKLFLEKYPEYGAVWPTLKFIGVKSRKTFYNWCESDSKFKAKYQEELLPNRRDELVSIVYRMATAHMSVAICPVCDGAGKFEKNNCHGCRGRGWVEVRADGTQLTAAFGFLKATDHVADDGLIFVEKRQLEMLGKDGNPITFTLKFEDGNEG